MGPQETVHNPKGWEAQGWSWHLQVLTGWALPQLPLWGARALDGPCMTLAENTQWMLRPHRERPGMGLRSWLTGDTVLESLKEYDRC